jgi:hypothetical protein
MHLEPKHLVLLLAPPILGYLLALVEVKFNKV